MSAVFTGEATVVTDTWDIAFDPGNTTFTLRFEDFEVHSEKILTPFVSRSRSVLVPLSGGDTEKDIHIRLTGYVVTTEDTSGSLLLTVNGTSTVVDFPPGSDKSVDHEFTLAAGPVPACQVSVVLLMTKPASPDGGGYLNILAIDGQIGEDRRTRR